MCKPAQTSRPHALVNALEGYAPRGATLNLGRQSLTAPPTGPTAGAAPDLAGAPDAGRKRRRGGGGGRHGGAGDGGKAPPAAPPAAALRTGICFAHNAGQCPGEVCPKGFVHKCSICGGPHIASLTSGCKDLVDPHGRPKKGKKGGGKGGK